MRKKIIFSALAPLTLAATLQAAENGEPRDRFHSVKKAISGVGTAEQKEMNVVDGFKHMFRDGKVTGQIRSMFSSYNYVNTQDVYATALGGFLKYELAEYKGLSATVTYEGSSDVSALSGSGVKRNTELSSSAKEVNVRQETYIDYNYQAFDLRVGRQILDTPLADSDDIRMIANSFQAAVVRYEGEELTFIGGVLRQWQGSDAGLENGWVDTGKDGTYFAGLSYSNINIDANLWAYNINGEQNDATANDALYVDVVGHFHINAELFLHTGVQYLYEKERDASGVAANIYGATAELVYKGLGVNVAYNKAAQKSGRQSFSGFGGGTLFTNMDSMILDAITADREADVWVSGVSYALGDLSALYAYGDFEGSKNSLGQSAHIIEQNVGIEYSKDDDFTLAAIYTKDTDKDNTQDNGGSWENLRILATYNF